MRNETYNNILHKSISDQINSITGKTLTNIQLVQYLMDNNDELIDNHFWLNLQKTFTQGSRQVKIFYMLYYTRRFFPPLGAKNRFEIAQQFYKKLKTSKSEDPNNIYESMVELFDQYHPQVVKQACQNIYYMHFKRHKPWDAIFQQLQEKADLYDDEQLEQERLTDTKFYNIENSSDDGVIQHFPVLLQTKKEKPATLHTHQSHRTNDQSKLNESISQTEFYSFSSSDSEFDDINQQIRYKTLEQYEEQLLKLALYRAKQLRGMDMTPLQLYIYYENHKEFFDSMWPRIKFSCVEVQKAPQNHFCNVQITRALPELNKHQQKYLMDNFDAFFRKSVEEKDELTLEYYKNPIFKNLSTKKQIRLFMSNVERKFSSNERRKGAAYAKKIVFADFKKLQEESDDIIEVGDQKIEVNLQLIQSQQQLLQKFEKQKQQQEKQQQKQENIIQKQQEQQQQKEQQKAKIVQEQQEQEQIQQNSKQIAILDIEYKKYQFNTGVKPDFSLITLFCKKIGQLKSK